MAGTETWEPDGGLILQVQAQSKQALEAYRAEPDLLQEHANHEESIRTGGYAHRTLLELVQNAADALSGTGQGMGQAAGRVEIVLDLHSKTLYCANAGRPFSKDGLRSITMAYLSSKRGDEIGRFGLGFKSVIAVSDGPQVFSRTISFEFNSTEAQQELAKISRIHRRFPKLRIATLVNALPEFQRDPVLAELAEWASTIIKLPNARNLERLSAEMKGFSSEFLLFVPSVRSVHLRIIGPEPFDTSHISRDLGGGVLRLERPDGEGDEWFFQDQMHEPSPAAREQVGEAVSRDKVKVTVAMPTQQSRLPRGQFWSYFPLRDRTSASALFNAPWSVNDDRTTLLENDYNREILGTLSSIFADLLPRVRTDKDPAAHLDYMPARGKEELSFGDRVLIFHVARAAAQRGLIPDASGALRHPTQLRPLDFNADVSFEASVHRAWTESPNTGDDVPSWRCYTTRTRATRLREMFIAAQSEDQPLAQRIDAKRALETMPKRGLLTWLREWAEGDDPISSADALKVVCGHPRVQGIDKASIIPTTGGLRALSDRNAVFLSEESDIELEGATFVKPDFLAQPGVEQLLRSHGFRDLDPEAVLRARLAKLSAEASDEQLTALWDAVLDVPVRVAAQALAARPTVVKVPTLDGGWCTPHHAIDLAQPLGPSFASRTLNRAKCLPDVAHKLGVIRGPIPKFPTSDESAFGRYQEWVIDSLNAKRGPGERPTQRIDFLQSEGPGPFSLLFMLRDAGAPNELRESWTTGLLKHASQDWVCEDLDTGRHFPVKSPVRWAAEQAGILLTSRGFHAPAGVVAPSLLKYKGLLPLLQGPSAVAEALQLPTSLETVPPQVLRDSLEADAFPSAISDSTLAEFVLTTCRLAYQGHPPPSIPARVKKAVEGRPPNSVYLATDNEQQDYLSTRHRPYLRVNQEAAAELASIASCRRFEEAFAFSIIIEGQQEPERIIDLFPGLRRTFGASRVEHATVARAARLVKRVTTEEGVEDQSLGWHLDGAGLVVNHEANEQQVLRIINDAFDLRLDNAGLAAVLKAGLDQRLEQQRADASAARTDAQRLEVYFGPDDLREALPSGLWNALRAQGLVGDATSIAELFLTVYGSDSISQLRENFRQLGFPDVPNTWAGGAATVSWLRKMGFGAHYAGRRTERQDEEFVVPGAVRLNPLHDFQQQISHELQAVITHRGDDGRASKAMVELPTGAGKTRVASETVLRLFIEGQLRGPVLWIAQSLELCEQAVQTWSAVWRGLADERPLTIGRLWENNAVHQPDTEFSLIVATDAKLYALLGSADYAWLSEATTLVIIDEGHRAGDSPMYTKILEWLGIAGTGWKRPLVGLSATPFKGTSQSATLALARRFGNRIIKAFEDDAYHELAARGVLAKVDHDVLPGIKVSLTTGEIEEARTLRRINAKVLDRVGRDQERMAILVEHIMQQNREWPILVFTPNVLSAQVLAASLRYRGISAASVSGQTGRQERRDLIGKFKAGDIQVLANCDLLIQGFDAPGVRALYIARPTFSPNAYIQMAGRGLRGPANGGKEECLIVDMADDFGDMSRFLGYREYEPLWKEQMQ